MRVQGELFADRLPRPLPTPPPARVAHSTCPVSHSPSSGPQVSLLREHTALPRRCLLSRQSAPACSHIPGTPPASVLPSVAARGSLSTTRGQRGRQGLGGIFWQSYRYSWSGGGALMPWLAPLLSRRADRPQRLSEHSARTFLHTCQPGVARVQLQLPHLQCGHFAEAWPTGWLQRLARPLSPFPSRDCTRSAGQPAPTLPSAHCLPASLSTSEGTPPAAHLGDADSSVGPSPAPSHVTSQQPEPEFGANRQRCRPCPSGFCVPSSRCRESAGGGAVEHDLPACTPDRSQEAVGLPSPTA